VPKDNGHGYRRDAVNGRSESRVGNTWFKG